MRVPFLDLSHVTGAVRDAFLTDLDSILNENAFVNGSNVAEFEATFASYVGCQDCIGLASGLDALRLGLLALDLPRGAEVIVPAMTFFATWEAITQAGAVPVPVDVDEGDYCLAPSAVASAVGARTSAIVPVHLYGQMADIESLLALAGQRGLAVVEDAAQAHGAERDGKRAGTSGIAAAFSFYPGKNLGAMGDAGALVTDDAALAARVRALREHGQYRKYHHEEIGWTARLDTIQAAVLLRKLPLLDGWNEERRRIAALYVDALRGVGDLVLPVVAARSAPVWHVFVIRTRDPEGLAAHLRDEGIGSGRHYPEPPHLSRAYADLGYSVGSFPVAEAIARECLSLPIFPGMTNSEVATVTESVRSWFDRG
jgi:dTDP-4-amino-4,6-dideoxygalactose transaminase